MSWQTPTVFIFDKCAIITSVLAGTFWLKGFECFKFTDEKECLKRFRELDGKVDAVVIIVDDDQTTLDNDSMLIVNIKRINPNTKILVISSKQKEQENKIYEYGADYIASRPLTPNDISDRILLMISKHKLLENPNDLV